MRHKWKWSIMPWRGKCETCGVRMKYGKPRLSKTNCTRTIIPTVFSTDGGKTWLEGDLPKCHKTGRVH